MAAAYPLKWHEAMAMYDIAMQSGAGRDAVLILLPATTGFRWSDWGKLQWKDLISAGEISKHEKKTGKKRAWPILAEVQDLIHRAYEAERMKVPPSKRDSFANEFVFKPKSKNSTSGVLTNRGVNFALTRLARKVGIQRDVSAHSLRKAFAMRMYEVAGSDENALNEVSMYLNHSNVQVTRAYLGFTEERRNSLISKMLSL